MRAFSWTVVIASGAVFLAAARPDVPRDAKAPREGDEQRAAVQLVLESQVKAWNRGDLEGFMAGYWKDDGLTFFSGKDPTKGWQATLERYRKKYQADGKEMGQLSFSDLDIHSSGERTAWVRGRWKLMTSKETFGGLFTLIVEKKTDGWRIVHDHTSG
jgi:beta-aspartyl-peptidase (threonine type)